MLLPQKCGGLISGFMKQKPSCPCLEMSFNQSSSILCKYGQSERESCGHRKSTKVTIVEGINPTTTKKQNKNELRILAAGQLFRPCKASSLWHS